jgi:AcrR family transcriptional regulator
VFAPKRTRPQTSQVRLLAAAKTLFAQLGYEQASTSAIARRAGTSESQLVRYFEGKRGLLAAVFDASWGPLNRQIEQTVARAHDEAAAIRMILTSVITAFERDPELAYLFLFEGRRVRASGRELELSRGYLEFVEILQRLIRRGQKARTISGKIDPAVLCSALVGAAEGMMRDRLIIERSAKTKAFSHEAVRRVFEILLDSIDRRRDSGANPTIQQRRLTRATTR